MSPDRRRARRRWATAVAVAAVVATACSGGGSQGAPVPIPYDGSGPETTTTPPPTSTSSTTSTTVKGSTTTSTTTRTTVGPITIGPGQASISGTVSSPVGPVDGATVRIERLVGSAVATAEVQTSGGGAFRFDSILGGAYRVSAFKPPDLTLSNVEAFFLAATERKIVELRLGRTEGERITAVINPSPPRLNQPAILTIQVGFSRVDAQGRPAVIPRVGATLVLAVGPGQVLESSAQVVTDATGSASWRLRCVSPGPNPVSLTIGGGTTQVNLPPCAAPAAAPAPTTTQAP